MKTRFLVSLFVPALAVGLLACSSSPGEPSSTSAGGASSSTASTSSSEASASGGSTGGSGGALPQAKHVAYLNFNGAVWAPGEDDATKRTSPLVQSPGGGKAVIAGFAGAIGPHPDGAQRDAIMAKATALVTAALAPFDVSVTTRRPTVPFTEVVIGGAPEDLGMAPGPAGVASAIDCDETNPTNTAFVFADSGALLISVEVDGAATTIASIALHELGHTWGLAHTDDVTDIMNPNDASALAWGSGNVVSGGPDVSDTCGRATQDSKAQLLKNLGPHVERAAVPVVVAGKGPVVAASTPVDAPEPGLAIGTKLAPCLKLESSSDALGAFAETWVQSNRWTRLTRSSQLVGAANPLVQFAPVDTPPGLPMFERMSVIDASDEVTEVRAWLLPKANGPVLPPCN